MELNRYTIVNILSHNLFQEFIDSWSEPYHMWYLNGTKEEKSKKNKKKISLNILSLNQTGCCLVLDDMHEVHDVDL